MALYKQQDFSLPELRRFKDTQRIAYQCVEEVRQQLRIGDTEKDAVDKMTYWMSERGVTEYFHKPYAWFGDRAAFENFWTPIKFFPTNRKLEENMPVILDIAPFIDGYISDIGFAFMFGADTELHQQMRKDLLAYRTLILDEVLAGKSFKSIYHDVDAMIRDHGYQRVHSRYPQRVLAHRVAKIQQTWKSGFTVGRFGLDGFLYLLNELRRAQFSKINNHAPVWNDGKESNHGPIPGLWAVEPHIACQGVGAKWEELLVITEDTAYWLDDQVPHVIEGIEKGWIKSGTSEKLKTLNKDLYQSA